MRNRFSYSVYCKLFMLNKQFCLINYSRRCVYENTGFSSYSVSLSSTVVQCNYYFKAISYAVKVKRNFNRKYQRLFLLYFTGRSSKSNTASLQIIDKRIPAHTAHSRTGKVYGVDIPSAPASERESRVL